MTFFEGLHQFFGKLQSIMSKDSLCEFDLPDSHFNVRLKSYRGEYYALFKIILSGEEYTLEISNLRLQWMLSIAKRFFEHESQGAPIIERYVAELDDKTTFQFLNKDCELSAEFITKFLFFEDRTFVSARDIKLFYEKLKRYSVQ